MSDRKVVDTIRLSSTDVTAIMAELDGAGGGASPSKPLRFLKRWKFRGSAAIVSVLDKANNRTNFVVQPRDLSASGIGVLHGAFIHPGTRCLVGLRRLDGTVATIPGKIVRCRHIRNRLHELGVQFDERVSPADFIAFDNEQVFQVERVELAKLSGTLLVVSDSQTDQQLLAHYFKSSGLDLIFAQDDGAAIGMIDEAPSLIFIDAQVAQGKGIELVQQLRDRGAAQPIIVLTAEIDAAIRERALHAGADEILVKPCPPELFHQAAAEYLESSSERDAVSALHFVVSSAKQIGLELELVESFAKQLRDVAKSLEDAIEPEDKPAIRAAALRVKGSAANFGFAPIGRAADDVLRALSFNHPRETKDAATRLRDLCNRARAVA